MAQESKTSDGAAEIRVIWAVLALGIVLAGADAFLTERLTDVLIHAQAQVRIGTPAQKVEPTAKVGQLDSRSIPADLEVKSAAEVEALNAGTFPRFESGESSRAN